MLPHPGMCDRWSCALQVSQEQFDKIMGLIQTGIDEGAKLEVGGKRYGMSFYLKPAAEILAADLN